MKVRKQPEKTDAEVAFMGSSVPKTPNLGRKNAKRVTFDLPEDNFEDADDLPDIDDDVQRRLNKLWLPKIYDNERPTQQVIDAVQEHIAVIDPYMDVLKEAQPGTHEMWQFMYDITLELANDVSDFEHKRFYSEPDRVKRNRLLAETNEERGREDYESYSKVYLEQLELRELEIKAIKSLYVDIAEAKTVKDVNEILRIRTEIELNAREAIHNHTVGNFGNALRERNENRTCIDKFFNKKVKPLLKANAKPQEIAEVLQKLKDEFESDVRLKEEEFNNVPNPAMDGNLHEYTLKARAASLSDKLDFYRSQNRDVMMHCIRLYVIAFRTYVKLYGESPIQMDDDKGKGESIPLIYGEEKESIFKVKPTFQKLVQGLKNNFDLYYCFQPDRYYFQEYLYNFNKFLNKDERDALLRGEFKDELMDKVFPEFETPTEAFVLPQEVKNMLKR